MRRVEIVATGVGNTASVRAGFARLGCETEVVTSPERIREARLLVLPGVGAFAAAMSRLGESEWVAPLQARVTERRPTLAVCLGMQLLGSGSGEAEDCPGLECVTNRAERFPPEVRVPHMGWSTVTASAGCELLEDGAAYFAHSYLWRARPEGWRAAVSRHGEEFLAAAESGPVLACQFHPELSGAYGEALLRRWLAKGEKSW